MAICIAKVKEFVKRANKKKEPGYGYGSPAEQCKSKLEDYLEIARWEYKQSRKLHKPEKNIEADQRYERVARLAAQLEQYDEAAIDIEEAHIYKRRAESENNVEKAIEYLRKAAELFESGKEVANSVECYEKAALLAVQDSDYSKAIEFFEKNASLSLNHSLLKHKVKTNLYNAGICRLCRGDAEKKSSWEQYRENAMIISLKRYQELDSSFLLTWQCESLKDFAYSVRECNLAIFCYGLESFDRNKTSADSWIANLLPRVKAKLEFSIKMAKSVRTRRPQSLRLQSFQVDQ